MLRLLCPSIFCVLLLFSPAAAAQPGAEATEPAATQPAVELEASLLTFPGTMREDGLIPLVVAVRNTSDGWVEMPAMELPDWPDLAEAPGEEAPVEMEEMEVLADSPPNARLMVEASDVHLFSSRCGRPIEIFTQAQEFRTMAPQNGVHLYLITINPTFGYQEQMLAEDARAMEAVSHDEAEIAWDFGPGTFTVWLEFDARGLPDADILYTPPAEEAEAMMDADPGPAVRFTTNRIRLHIAAADEE